MSLYELQKQITAALNSDQTPEIAAINSCGSLSTIERLAIYASSSMMALINTLRDTYPICAQLVGDAFFNAMTEIYVRQTPSLFPNIMDYGSSFAQFIANFPPAQSLPYLADVAALEWACHRALHGKNSSALDIEILTRMTEDEYASVVFELPANSTLLASDYPIHRIWEFHQANYQGENTIDLAQGGIKLIIWRQHMDLRIDVVTAQEWLVLQAVKDKYSIAALCKEIELIAHEINLPILLGEFLKKGWITGLSH